MSTDFLEAVEEQLIAATERGTANHRWRRPWPRRMRLPWRAPTIGIVAGVGTALAASAIAATLTLPASHTRVRSVSSARSTRSYTTAGAVPAGFEPQSFTAVSEFTWWLLGTAPCDGRTCTAIVRTTNGGPSFTRVPAPPVPMSAVGNIRFANATDGYAFGPELWSTHDGGRTWTRLHLGAEVENLAAADGYVYAIVYGRHGSAALMRSAVGADQWSVLPVPGAGGLSGLWVQGSTVIVQSGGRMLVSSDQGASFASVTGVQGAGDCSYDAVDTVPPAIWAVCIAGMAPDRILLSTDSGGSFRTAAQIPNGPINAFAAASVDVAVASGQGPLYRTVDGGTSWAPVSAPTADWTYLGFTDSTHGVAIGMFGSGEHPTYRLYYTTDAGASYHYVPVGP